MAARPPSAEKSAAPETRRELDAIDRRILRLLQTHARATNQWLAAQVELSPTPCLERVRRLEREGYIREYQAILDPARVGYPMLIFAFVLFDRAVDGVYEQFRAAIAEIGEIVECHMITGDVDFIMKIRVADIGAFRVLLEDKILKLPGVRITHSYVAMDEVKTGVSTPVAD
ncbi:Lrp/AsnC ligand binding domain-containing protein [Bordetella petrii]|uniref:Lrp/AsnC ligand binding domain-containing protein n=1 Tax=Bordetella petrii TaxID=94624 RepID=A0ABT7W8I6_9BORD|nr:Lrp/AsnC ligand binding domain-containing protein [Bordetella petrii]MDM9561510.1 Lrp/AsnC ligand binding domain-containing protein [Bordetella petrii]